MAKFCKNSMLVLVSAIIGLICAEAVARLAGYNPFTYRPESPWHLPVLTGDQKFGWKNAPGIHQHSFLPNNGHPVTTTISADGARVFPGISPTSGFIEIYGGSMGFGWGVTDGKTVGAVLARATGARTVNRSVGGYGSLQALMALEKVSQNWTPSSKPAAIVYLQATHHMNRSSGEPEWVLSNERNNPRGGRMKGIPYARFAPDGTFIIKGAQRYPAFPYRNRSALANLADQAWVRFDRAISIPDMLKVQAEIIRKMAALSHRVGTPFFVIALYSQAYDFDDLKEAVGAVGVNWGYCLHPGFPAKKFTVPNDGHPNDVVHRYYGKCVAKALAASRLGETTK